MNLVATTSLGLEEILGGELRRLGAGGVRVTKGAVRFQGDWAMAWRTCLRLRTANRVLLHLGEFPAADDAALARGVASFVYGKQRVGGVAISDLLRPERSIAFRATSRHSHLRDTRWIAQRAKDGLVDAQRGRFGERSSVDRRTPEVPLRIWLSENRASLLLDMVGDSLDRRGVRVRSVDAPMRENLAAACVLAGLDGWEGDAPEWIVDPMCGSGTLLIEAAWILQGKRPSALRDRWIFEGWSGFDAAGFSRVLAEPIEVRRSEVGLLGIDRAPEAVASSRANLEAAGLADQAEIRLGDAYELEEAPAPRGLVLVNPSWGERLPEGDASDWRRLGDLLKQRFGGWRAVVFAGDQDRGKHLGLRPKRRIPVQQGPVDARILVLDLY